MFNILKKSSETAKPFKITKDIAMIAGLVLLAGVAGGIYFFSNYSILKTGNGQQPGADQADNGGKDGNSFLNLKVVKKDKDLSAEEAAKKAIDFANTTMLADGPKAELVSVREENGLYAFKLKLEDQEYESYVTKNGKMLFVQGVKIEEAKDENKVPEVTKSDKPDVKIFVMSYCPFGLQAQKMYLPVYELLKDKADMGIYFVNYAMHGKGEVDENLRQYCVQKDQKDKYAAYMKCFMEDDAYDKCSESNTTGKVCTANFDKCLTQAGIDKSKLAGCIAETDKNFNVTADYNDKSTWVSGQFPKFAVQDDLNTKYNVQGSPTIIINEAEADVSPRTPEQFKQVICAAFNSAPAECGQKLSEETPSTGFGAATGGTSGGGCGN